MTTREPRDRHLEEAGQPMELLWAPPSYGSFLEDDQVTFRFLLNHRGWAIGLLWWASERPGVTARAGVTWASSTEVTKLVWAYLSQAAGEGVGASAAHDAVVADTPSAFWSDEFVGTGVELEGARRWLQGFSRESASWSAGAHVPGRTITQDIDSTFRCFVAYSKGQVQGLHAHRRGSLLWREDGLWWRVPMEDTTLRWDRLVEVRPAITDVVDLLGAQALSLASVRGFSV